MEENQQAIVPADGGWRARVVVMGGIIGAVLGLLSAYLYLRAAEETHGPEGTPQGPETRDAVKLGVALLAIIRTISEWGKR